MGIDNEGRRGDTITWIARDMRYKRRMKRFCRIVHRLGAYIPYCGLDMRVYPGDIEEIGWLSRCDTFENVSEDWGIYEEINRPDIYGFYRTSHEGCHMTLEECTSKIGREEWYDYDANVMYGPPVAVVNIDWKRELGV